MIAPFILDWVMKNAVLPNEKVKQHYFKKTYNKVTKKYCYTLSIIVEGEDLYYPITREILLGTTHKEIFL